MELKCGTKKEKIPTYTPHVIYREQTIWILVYVVFLQHRIGKSKAKTLSFNSITREVSYVFIVPHEKKKKTLRTYKFLNLIINIPGGGT